MCLVLLVALTAAAPAAHAGTQQACHPASVEGSWTSQGCATVWTNDACTQVRTAEADGYNGLDKGCNADFLIVEADLLQSAPQQACPALSGVGSVANDRCVTVDADDNNCGQIRVTNPLWIRNCQAPASVTASAASGCDAMSTYVGLVSVETCQPPPVPSPKRLPQVTVATLP